MTQPDSAPQDEPTSSPAAVRLPRPPRSLAATLGLCLAAGALGGVGGYALADGVAGPASGIPPVPPASVEASPGSLTAVVEAVLPSVVAIETDTGGGSGFVISSEGHVLTNHHVVGSSEGTVTVVYSDGVEEQGEVLGSTSEYDLAVVKVGREGLRPLVLADSEALRVGDPVIAIGSPLGLDATVTSGIISALHRPVTTGGTDEAPAFIDAIQTDAAINPGNSGGPLLNLRGEVVGINSAAAALPGSTAQTGVGTVGLGFAIPSEQARRTSQELIETGEATYPVVGVILDEAYQGRGVRVAADDPGTGLRGVSPGSPADRAGMLPGDVVVEFEDRPISRPAELIVAIRAKAPGDAIRLTVLRGDERVVLTVTLVRNTEVTWQDGSDDDPEPTPDPSSSESAAPEDDG